MKRYLVFSDENYYPGGGWNDFKSDYDSKEEAIESAKAWGRKHDYWAHVVDTWTMEIIHEG